MARSASELESILGIIPIEVTMGGVIPYTEILNTYKETPLGDKIQNFVTQAKELKFVEFSFRTIQKLGLLAESYDLILAYFILDPFKVHLFFHPICTTEQWMALFKEHTTRRVFFDYIKTYKQTRVYEPISIKSICTQLLNTMCPNDWSTSILPLNDKYLMVRVTSDFSEQSIMIYKIDFPGFLPVKYELDFYPNQFNRIELKVEDTVFVGPTFTSLWDGKESECSPIISVSNKMNKYLLDAEKGILQVLNFNKFTRSYYVIPKFSVKKNCCILKKLTEKLLLLNNGWVWNTENNTFKNTLHLFQNQDLKILSMSATTFWVVISPIKGFVELLTPEDFVEVVKDIPDVFPELINVVKS